MKYLLLLALFSMNVWAAAQSSNMQSAASNNAQQPVKDPVMIKISGKEVKLSQIMPMLVTLVGGNINNLSKEQLLVAIDMAKKMYVMQEVLLKEAKKNGYESKKEYAELYQRAKDNVSIDIWMREAGKKISEAELKNAYPSFIANKSLSDYKFNIIVVKDQNVARSVLAGLNSGSSFQAIAKEKSIHRSADRADTPGAVEFMREDYIANEFGMDFLKKLKSMSAGELNRQAISLADGNFAIVKFVGKRKSAPLTFNEAKPMLAMQVTNQKLENLINQEIKSGKIEFYSLDGKKEAITNFLLRPQPAKVQPAKEAAKAQPK